MIPDPVRKKPRCDTRTQPQAYFSKFLKTDAAKKAIKGRDVSVRPHDDKAEKGKEKEPAPTGGDGKALRPKTLKASVFFENLECHVQDDNLIPLTNEIKKINHVNMPIAASLMFRALLEGALVYKIKQAKKWGELINEGKDPMLADLLKFAAKFDNGVFAEKNICKVLGGHLTQQAKTYLDAMTHLKYQQADPTVLASMANNLRGTIKYILEGN